MTSAYSAQPPPDPGSRYPVSPRNGFGTTALVTGVVGLLVAWIPIIGFLGFILGTIAVIFGAIAIFRAHKDHVTSKGLAYSGTILGVVAFVVSIIVFAAFANEVSKISQQGGSAAAPPPATAPQQPGSEGPSGSSSPPATNPTDGLVPVTYTATSSTGTASVTYGGGTDGMSIVTEEVPSGWSKTVQMEQLLGTPITSLQVTTPPDMSAPLGQKVTVACELKVNGKTVDHQEATGSVAYVMCGG